MMKEAGRKNRSSDDDEGEEEEEEDRQNLIPQNETKPNSTSHSFSAFRIDDDEFSSSARRRFRFDFRRLKQKRYFWGLLVPVGVLLYFFVDFGNLFRSVGIWDVKFPGSSFSSSDRMREAELRALNLLSQQQSGLISLLNHALVDKGSNRSSSALNINSSYSNSSELAAENLDYEHIKSRIYDQILLNKEIQQVLLSTHNKGNNISELGDESEGLTHMCDKVNQRLSERRTIEWNPRKNKFLFAICVSGQMSNHLICLEKHMFFAAVMKRILVIPSSKFDYQYNRVIDIEHINSCLGRKVVISFEEFYEMKKKDMRIDRFICYFSLPQHCYLDDDHVKKLKALGLSVPKLQSPWTEDVREPSKKTLQDVESKFTAENEVVAIGDVFFADVEKGWVMQPSGPIAHKCKTLIEPSRLILLTAQRFIQTFLGKDYVALHFRRHGFLKFCNAKEPSCFFPVPQAADCITRVVERAKTPVIYLSTDAADSETGLLQSLIVVDGRPIPLVKRPARIFAEKWDALLYRHGLQEDSQVEAMLDKTICAMSTVFIGSSGSTFTEDILRLRKDWGSASLCDEYICQGEVPNIIAENE